MKKLFLILMLALLGMTQLAAQEYESVPFVREGVKLRGVKRGKIARREYFVKQAKVAVLHLSKAPVKNIVDHG